MSQQRTHDLKSNLVKRVSIAPGSNYSAAGNIDGDYVQADDIQGPAQALCSCGAATGSPTAQSVNFEMWQADDSSGTNAEKVTTQDEVTLTADKTADVLRAHHTRPYVRVRVIDADSSLTDGSSPAIDVGAVVVGQKRSY